MFFSVYMWRPDNLGWGVLLQELFIIFSLFFGREEVGSFPSLKLAEQARLRGHQTPRICRSLPPWHRDDNGAPFKASKCGLCSSNWGPCVRKARTFPPELCPWPIVHHFHELLSQLYTSVRTLWSFTTHVNCAMMQLRWLAAPSPGCFYLETPCPSVLTPLGICNKCCESSHPTGLWLPRTCSFFLWFMLVCLLFDMGFDM